MLIWVPFISLYILLEYNQIVPYFLKDYFTMLQKEKTTKLDV